MSAVTVTIGDWTFVWSHPQHRLADVLHANGDHAIHCIQVGDFEHSRRQGEQQRAPFTEETLRADALQWIEEEGEDHMRNAVAYL